MNHINNLYKFSSEPLTKAQEWAIGGGLTAGGAVALKQLLHALISKKYRKNYSFTKGLRNILLGGLLGSGAAYGLNKGISNYTVNSLKYGPFGYSDKIKFFKPDNLKDFWYRLTTTPNARNLSLDYKGESINKYLDSRWPKEEADSRRELLARTFGVFDGSKGTVFRVLNDKEKNDIKSKFPNIYESYIKRYGEDSILTPNKENTDFNDGDFNRLMRWGSIKLNKGTIKDLNEDNLNELKKYLKPGSVSGLTAPVLRQYTNTLSDDKKHILYSDVWDYEPNENEFSGPRNDSNDNPYIRKFVNTLLVNPVPILGLKNNNMEAQNYWENQFKE